MGNDAKSIDAVAFALFGGGRAWPYAWSDVTFENASNSRGDELASR